MKELFDGLSIYDFQDQFGDEKSCTDTLVKLKWSDGFKCRYCGYGNYCKTKRYGERRCCSCKKPESATAKTLFHKLKFPLHKAFLMLYLITTNKRGISSAELHRKVGVHKRTALLFKRKAMEAMGSHCNYKMDGEVEVDETSVGQKEKGKPGRSKGSKKLVVVAIQRAGKGISKVYARHISNAGVKELKPFFEDHIDLKAKIKTDKWRSYTSLKKSYKNLKQEASNNGKNFDLMHRFIMGFKAWLRGIHSSVRDLQKYLDEYCYRFNRNRSGGNIFNLLLKRMVNYPPKTSREIFGVS